MSKRIKNKGISLTEVIIASAVMLLVVVATSSAYNVYVQYALANEGTIQTGYLLEEELEVISLIRDSGWTAHIASLTSGTTYYISFNGVSWVITTTPQYVDGKFLRSFVLADVNRDAHDDISVSGTNDPNTKKVTATVASFEGHATTTQSISTYITNINND